MRLRTSRKTKPSYNWVFYICILQFFFSVPVWAEKIVQYTGSPVMVKVAHKNPTEIRFEHGDIASVILGLPAGDISLENSANTLYIQPLVEEVSGDIYVVMRDGKSKILTLVSTLPNLRDRSVRVIDASDSVAERVAQVTKIGVTPAGLIKSMVLGEDMDGVSISASSQVIVEVPIKLVAKTVYDAIFLQGYIVELPDSRFDLKQLSMKGLVAGAIYKNNAYLVRMQ